MLYALCRKCRSPNPHPPATRAAGARGASCWVFPTPHVGALAQASANLSALATSADDDDECQDALTRKRPPGILTTQVPADGHPLNKSPKYKSSPDMDGRLLGGMSPSLPPADTVAIAHSPILEAAVALSRSPILESAA